MIDLIRRLECVPYVAGGRDWSGMDCFGLVELWHRHLGVEINDRGEAETDPEGLAAGYARKALWQQMSDPIDHCVIIMRAPFNGEVFKFGHCGMYYNGYVYHTSKGTGFQCQNYTDRKIIKRVTDIRKHVCLL